MAKFKCFAFINTAANEHHRKLVSKFGMDCGYANGYVAVPEGHPLYGKSYDDAMEVDGMYVVHGGITFSESMQCVFNTFDYDKIEWLDTNDSGEIPNSYWVFGFDTMHYGDSIGNCSREWCINEVNILKCILENL